MASEQWYVAAKKADFDKWAEQFHISPVLARILRNRNLTEEEEIDKFLNGTLKDCYSPWLLKDMDRAVEVILDAVRGGKYIRIIGDYDVDGICSTYILQKGFEALGAKADTAIPHRIHDGYGLNEHLIEEAKADGVQLIVTCDNGIAAAPQIELARLLGMQVVVTDHHEVPFVEEEAGRRELLPEALAVVDPHRGDCNYPFKGICGAVVAYKLVAALFERAQAAKENVLEELLEFAAFATVCDVMELLDENRILVKEGLKRLQNTRNIGLRALMEVNNIMPDKLSAYHLGFILGPCLNATGRLDTAGRSLELLQSRTKVEAMSAARELKDLNDSRKNLTREGVEAAEEYIKNHHIEKDAVMLIFLPHVHESLAGIIAGRIKESYHHPVFILTRGEEGVKGSGRSIEAYHMYEHMTAVKQYFTRFGGHRMAAGLSMREEDIEPLRRALNEGCGLEEKDFVPRVHIDVPLPLSYADEALARELSLLEPFGVGNPKPLFAQKNLVFRAGFKMGTGERAARFRVQAFSGAAGVAEDMSGGAAAADMLQLVYFGDLERFGAFLRERYGEDSERQLYAGRGNFPVSVTYQLGLNTYKGRTQVQCVMQNYC